MTKPTIRRATASDIPLLVSHHVKMFREIRDLQGKARDPGKMARMETCYARKLDLQLVSGACAAWVAQWDGHAAARGQVEGTGPPSLHRREVMLFVSYCTPLRNADW